MDEFLKQSNKATQNGTKDYSWLNQSSIVPPNSHINPIVSAQIKKSLDPIDLPVITNVAILTCICIILLLSISATIIFIQRRKKKHRNQYFLDGKPELIKRHVLMHEQANLLPYDEKYEFPKKKLVRGNRLGSGAFGSVEVAVAHGILPQERETKVVVKRVDYQSTEEAFRTLLLELKILIHLKRHLNVIGLLGAVTTKIHKRKLLVIVEYCQFGSVKEFLVKRRHSFVDQINHMNDRIDFNRVGKTSKKSSCNVHSNSLSSSTSTLITIDELKIMPDTLRSNPTRAAVKMSTNVSLAELNSPLRPVATIDLLLWSYQIARGMEYLASLNVVHGDLSARNILLSDRNVVKICNIGSAHGFTISSDVWSFGILLWELFSLGEEPYQDIDNDDLFTTLNDGYTLQQPKHATKNIYSIMSSCWNKQTRLRPKFNELAHLLSDIIPTDRTKAFDDLNASIQAANNNFSN